MTSQNLSFKEVLEKIARVNAMDYEYQRWAREALAAQPAQPAPVPEGWKLALESAYLAGFNASGEGYNGEYGIDRPEEDAIWKKRRDNELVNLTQSLEEPVQEPVAC